jgi:single-stranded-DNA-specific exonuclease
VPGVDLGRAVRAAVDAAVALKGGGHAMAAGATVAGDGIARFGRFLTDAISEGAVADYAETLGIDGTLMAGAAQPALVAAIERAGPFGAGQPEPVFALANHRLVEAREVGSGGHVRIRLRGQDGSTIGGIAFRAAGQPLGFALSKALGTNIHAAGSLCVDRWGGGEKVELRLCDIATPAAG